MMLPQENRWDSKPRLAAALKAVIYAVPFVVSALTIRLTQALVATATLDFPWLLTALVSVLAAAAVLVVSGRLMRRLLPLALLLKLSLFFPDQVPSRFGVALRAASPRRLARQLESADAEQASVAERVLALVSSLTSHDRRTRGHSERVRALTMLIADQMGIVGEDRDKLEWAALLHDLGKLDVPAEILNKRGRPSDDEWAVLRQHPAGGPSYASGLAQWMGPWIHAMDQHHERYDGSGYPNGITAEDITLSGRIVAVSDAFEVMTATRSYKKPMTAKAARTELVACAGTHFDPSVVRSFMQITIGDLHKALGPLSWLGSLPLVGPAVQAIASSGSGVVLGGSVSPALAAAAALTLLTSVPSPAEQQPAAEVLASIDASVVEVEPIGEGLSETVDDGSSEAPDDVDEPDPGGTDDNGPLDDVIDDDGPDGSVEEAVDTVTDELTESIDDLLAKDILEGVIEDLVPDDLVPDDLVPDDLVEQVIEPVAALVETPAPLEEPVEEVASQLPDDETADDVADEATEAVTEVGEGDETPIEEVEDLLGGLG